VEISQVLLNLVNNSYQAIATQSRPVIRILCEETVDHYTVRIIDSGEGIPPLIRQKLFQPFFTTKDVGVGTGLGLSISRGIIEEHEGRLYYQDDSPNTMFVIELPKIKS
jgi:C4-dicarboxylate-specific signal transduction histidine kinase